MKPDLHQIPTLTSSKATKSSLPDGSIHPHHFQEWLHSAVDPDLIRLNLKSLSGYSPLEYLLYGLPNSERRNDGRLRDKWLRRYAHCSQGGWWCSGIDILTGEPGAWGQFKPNQPLSYQEISKGFDLNTKVKIIKYEPPRNVPTEIYALQVPSHIWDKIAQRYSIKRYHSPLALRLQDRHKPLTFWSWVLAHPEIPLIITEGAKKAGALLTAGYAAIALPGINNGYRQPKDSWGNKISKRHLIPQLKALTQKDREIIFCFDRDTKPETIKAVNNAITQTGKLFEQENCQVSVISWDYPEKGVDDLIAARGENCFSALYNGRKSLAQFQLLKLLDLSPYVSLRVKKRYLGEDLEYIPEKSSSWLFKEKLTPISKTTATYALRHPLSPRRACQSSVANLNENGITLLGTHNQQSLIPEEANIIGISSAKGTGKTEWLAQIVTRAIAIGQRVIILCHREQLAVALAHRFGVDYRTEIRTSVTKGVLGYSLCVDSLHPQANPPFNPDDWQEALVIIDEVEQVIWHLLHSDTCRYNRVAILESFRTLLQTVVATGGKVYLSDADLSPISIDYIQKLIGFPVKTWIVENSFNPLKGKRKLITYSGNDPRELVAALVRAIAAGEKPLIHTSAQKAKSKWGTTNLESYLKRLFPQRKILRIDAESVADPEHPAYGCMGNLNAILPLYDLVICSPTVETGVSIDISGAECTRPQAPPGSLELKRGIQGDGAPLHLGQPQVTAPPEATSAHSPDSRACLAADSPPESNSGERTGHFTSVWSIAEGVQTVDAVCQSLERLRDDVPRHLWAKKTGINRVGNGATEVKQLLAAQHKLTKTNIQLLQHIQQLSAAGIDEFEAIDFNFQPESLLTWAKRATVVNAGMARYRESILEKLREEGYESVKANEVVRAEGEQVKAEINQTQKVNYQQHCQEVAAVETPTETELEQLEKKRAKTSTERLKEKKGKLERKYGIEAITPSLVEKDDNGWYPKLLLHYYLTIGNKYLADKDKRSLSQMREQGNDKIFKPDLNKRQLLAPVKALEIIGIKQFLDSAAEFTSSSLQEWFERIKQWRHEIKTLLGMSINPERDTAIGVAQRLLGLLGLKLEFKCWRGSRRDKHRVYQGCNQFPDEREGIFSGWLSRDEKMYQCDTVHTSF